MTRASIPTLASHTRGYATKICERLNLNMIGSYSPRTYSTRFFLLITNELSQFRWISFTSSQSNFTLQTDNTAKIINPRFQKCLHHAGITSELTLLYTPGQNGAAERANRTSLDTIPAKLQCAGLKLGFWKLSSILGSNVKKRSCCTFDFLVNTSSL